MRLHERENRAARAEMAGAALPAPEGPDLPVQPPPSEGNCCIRTGNNLKKLCKGAMSCCTKEFDDTGDCEAEKGFWFFTPEGCAGAWLTSSVTRGDGSPFKTGRVTVNVLPAPGALFNVTWPAWASILASRSALS